MNLFIFLDADYFFQGNCGSSYMYLETIQEETSDDLQSDSDVSEARTSPVGWLATDSEAGSVICMDKGECLHQYSFIGGILIEENVSVRYYSIYAK